MFAATAFEHVLDTTVWPIFETLHWEIPLPPFVTKYSILMAVAAVLIMLVYLPLAKKIQTGEPPTGRFWNFFEFLLTFIRDNVAKPYIPGDADRYVPYLWTVFLFVLTCNLLGMLPFMGSPTASFAVTSVLAFGSFLFIHLNSIFRVGVTNHLMSFAPPMELPIGIKIPLLFMLWPIEFIGMGIKCFVLSVRLFANMFAGHMVLATILLFIEGVAHTNFALEASVTIASVLGVTALSLLELFVAFLQAFIFTFLTALFFGGVLEHAEHVAHGDDHSDAAHGAEHAHGAEPALEHH